MSAPACPSPPPPPGLRGWGAGPAPPPPRQAQPVLPPQRPPPSVSGRVARLALKATFLGLLGYSLYWMGRRAASLVLALPAAQHCLQRAAGAWPPK